MGYAHCHAFFSHKNDASKSNTTYNTFNWDVSYYITIYFYLWDRSYKFNFNVCFGLLGQILFAPPLKTSSSTPSTSKPNFFSVQFLVIYNFWRFYRYVRRDILFSVIRLPVCDIYCKLPLWKIIFLIFLDILSSKLYRLCLKLNNETNGSSWPWV